ncbi:STAS domain-containing protein [Paenibacillus physcomitrellae]|uniref:STAS domain-containing protein n=1 Tax=Paenibacillus physcomitrellae TaxID=1619311 RepID=A0ABQ1FU34_9BACL|nr:STAS domain-containing protein [Paenibacillus physcomitrellae]GGA29693.1 hypothetical protein GCM10010917_13420 [Paenibacillus physcomitrellae]
MTLKVETTIKESVFTIILKGLIDYSTVDEFNSFQVPENVSRIIVSFKEVDFIDSTGIGSVLTLIHFASDHDIQVEFVDLDDSTRELFETIGVFKVMEALLKEGR